MSFYPTDVEATYTSDGWPIPVRLHWAGEALPVVDVGRRWKSDDGIHILVRVPDGRVFELQTNGSTWQAKILSAPPHFA